MVVIPDRGERADAVLLRLEDRQEVGHDLRGQQQLREMEPQLASLHACRPEERSACHAYVSDSL